MGGRPAGDCLRHWRHLPTCAAQRAAPDQVVTSPEGLSQAPPTPQPTQAVPSQGSREEAGRGQSPACPVVMLECLKQPGKVITAPS